MKLNALEKERLLLEAEQHVAKLDYAGICAIAPRHDHWWKAQSEHELYNTQRKAAVDKVFNRLLKAAKKGK